MTTLSPSVTMVSRWDWNDALKNEPRRPSQALNNLLGASTPVVTAFDLRAHAEKRASVLRSQATITETPALRRRFDEVLDRVVVDGAPTPQVGATPDGSVEIQWLCGGMLAALVIEHDGYVSIALETDFLDSSTEFEVEPEEPFSGACVDVLAAQLRDMGKKVRRRSSDWHNA